MRNQNCYLLDTSVILDDPTNILRIYDEGQNVVVISNIVLSELNNKKDDMRSDAGFRAREFFRLSDNEQGHAITYEELPTCIQQGAQQSSSLIQTDYYYVLYLPFDTSLHNSASSEAIPLYIIYRPNYRISQHFDQGNGLNDAKIGEIAQEYHLTLLTNDISFKIAAEVQGIQAQSIRNSRVENPDKIEFVHTISYEDEPQLLQEETYNSFDQLIFVQEAHSDNSEIYETGIQRYGILFNNQIEWCDFDKRFGDFYSDELVRPINLEQKFYFSILTHPHNSVSVITGSTGSGKTLIALQAGLELVKEGIVDGIVYARNTVTSNDQASELGFRKGDEGQKLGYFMYPIYSAINFTIEHQNKYSLDARVEYTGNTNSIKRENATELFMDKHNIEAIDIAHLRGTTISKKFVIIDEAQNMTNATLKLIGTRMGEGTRLVIMGDTHQIDHPFLSKRRNALVTMLQKAQHSPFIAGLQLRHTIRSEIANWFDKNF
ncbi:MAG TPA: phosphate starvation-inducible protein PhoH [Helicobacteraceae bacterium]|nr:phosphate starvation-inducible protein PhoH [Helicobacteraceae bacterium]